MKKPRVTASADRKWLALALLCAVQFMVVLDIAIVNVALLSIQSTGLSPENLQWVDQRLRAHVRRAFCSSAGAPPTCWDAGGSSRARSSSARLARRGLPGGGALIGARALQGLGAAVITPAALSIRTHLLREGAQQPRRLGRRRCHRRRRGRAPRRRPHRRSELGVDLLRERSRRLLASCLRRSGRESRDQAEASTSRAVLVTGGLVTLAGTTQAYD